MESSKNSFLHIFQADESWAWRDPHTDPPFPGDRALVRLNNCKRGNYVEIKIRKGEGLGYIDKWILLKDVANFLLDQIVNDPKP